MAAGPARAEDRACVNADIVGGCSSSSAFEHIRGHRARRGENHEASANAPRVLGDGHSRERGWEGVYQGRGVPHPAWEPGRLPHPDDLGSGPQGPLGPRRFAGDAEGTAACPATRATSSRKIQVLFDPITGGCACISTPVDCSSPNTCFSAGTCDPTQGCQYPVKDGAVCTSDSNACTGPGRRSMRLQRTVPRWEFVVHPELPVCRTQIASTTCATSPRVCRQQLRARGTYGLRPRLHSFNSCDMATCDGTQGCVQQTWSARLSTSATRQVFATRARGPARIR